MKARKQKRKYHRAGFSGRKIGDMIMISATRAGLNTLLDRQVSFNIKRRTIVLFPEIEIIVSWQGVSGRRSFLESYDHHEPKYSFLHRAAKDFRFDGSIRRRPSKPASRAGLQLP
jgi:hypothetical protein